MTLADGVCDCCLALSFPRGQAWYSEPRRDDNLAGAPTDVGAPVTMEEIQYWTQLDAKHVEDAFEAFAGAANEEGLISRDAFFRCFVHEIVSPEKRANLTRESSERLKLVVEVLFGIFDTDGEPSSLFRPAAREPLHRFTGNGVVDFTELASGLSVLCGGSRDDKVKAAFSLYDINGANVDNTAFYRAATSP